MGARPQPTNGLSLEQTITVSLEYSALNFNVSSATSGIPTYASVNFALANFPGATNLLGVFDQYRFEQIETWMDFSSPNSVSAFPIAYSAVDLDDSNTATSVQQIQDHLGAIVATGPSGHYHKWKPHYAVAAYSGAFTSYSNMEANWIDSASPGVQHYGLKTALLSGGAAAGVNLTIRAVVSFRAPSIN